MENVLGCRDVSIWALSSVTRVPFSFRPSDSSVLVCKMGIILPAPAAQKGGGVRRLREEQYMITGARHTSRCALSPRLCQPL